MYKVTLTDTETVDGTISAAWDHESLDAAQAEARIFVSDGAGLNPAYHVTQHADKTVYWLGSREAWIEPPLTIPER